MLRRVVLNQAWNAPGVIGVRGPKRVEDRGSDQMASGRFGSGPHGIGRQTVSTVSAFRCNRMRMSWEVRAIGRSGMVQSIHSRVPIASILGPPMHW